MAKPTILVVDDEVFFRRLFTDILTEEDLYVVETANSGEEALERISAGGIDVVVTDMVMPNVCGLELLKRSRSFDNPPDVILATGNATVETAIQALKNGARDYLLKPCNPDQLRHTVHSCVEQRRLLGENTLLRSQIRLYQRGQNLAAQLDVNDLFSEALATLIHEGSGLRGAAFLVNPNGVSHVTPGENLNEEQGDELALKLAETISSLESPVTFRGEDLGEFSHPIEDLRSAWVFPMVGANEMHGAIVLLNAVGEDFPGPAPEGPLQFLAEQVALGFENACQYHGARELIYTDDLTGLYNHRYLHIALEQEIRRAERYGLEFSLAFIDLDLFKNVNDTHGHLVGSKILKDVGKLLKHCVRDADMLFRYGGDEFTALLVETDSRGAKVVAERIRAKIDNHEFVTDGQQSCRLTATVGHATYPIHASQKEDLIALADKAMYQGKNQRNATCSASELPRK